MAEAVMELFADPKRENGSALAGTGVLPYQTLKELVRQREIVAADEIQPDQLQPASLDLRLSNVVYRVPASFLPGAKASVLDKIRQFGGHPIDLTNGAVLEKGCVYIAPLMERLALKSRISAFANPKSSTGRLDVFTRIITDQSAAFDLIEAGYEGPLYAEIAPRTFSILARKGSRFSQLRLRRGTPVLGGAGIQRLQNEPGVISVVNGRKPAFKDDTIGVTLDLAGDPHTHLVGFRAKKHTDIVDVDVRNHYHASDFWEPIYVRSGRGIILNPDDFYILATKEFVRVPPEYAAEMVAYDTLVGEFRVHYAGFFDPGFGYGPDGGFSAKAVLEVRSHDVPFLLEHEQIIGWLRYEKLTGKADRTYGQELGSHYQAQGLQLGKQFKPFVA